MATITSDTFLDSGTARTAGETWTIQNCVLTVRTDTRWHAGAPASMTGSIGALTVTTALGGGYKIDATAVRWMPFDGGSGTVPAIGTTITQGGVSGYLLGVWQDYTSAPTAVGAAMPATGFIKFREVTGGAFSAGALSGISASATSADVTGWIEVVHDQSTFLAFSPLGEGFVTTGGWFYLDNTTGTPGQIIQVPTNGGGSATTVNAIQIETAPGSGVFEWYNGVNSSFWLTTILNTDARAKFVQTLTNGQVRIGSDGTNNIGYTPPSGCRVRIPNIFLRACTTAARATNTTPSTTVSTRPQFNTGSGGGKINISNVHSDWYTLFNTPTTVSLTDSAFESRFGVNAGLDVFTATNCATGNPSNTSVTGLLIQNHAGGVVMSGCKITGGSNSAPFNVQTRMWGGTFTNCIFAYVNTKTSSLATISLAASVKNATFTGCSVYNGRVNIAGSSDNVKFTNTDYIERLAGNAVAASGSQLFDVSGSSNVTIDGITFGLGGALNNCHQPGPFLASGSNTNVKLRNVGTVASPLNTGSDSATYPTYLISSSAPDDSIEIKRVYVSNLRFALATGSNSGCTNYVLQNCGGSRAQTLTTLAGSDFKVSGIFCSGTLGAQTNGTGSFWIDRFTSTTAGNLQLSFNPPSPANASQVTLSVSSSAKSGFGNNGFVYLKTAGDYIIVEMSDWVRGHTGFQNSTPNFNGTNATTKQNWDYQIDTGAGYGSWKSITAANLSGETISPSTGFKLKVRVTASASDNTNSASSLIILTNSTQSAQENNLYALDTSALSFTGLQAGSEVRCYTGSDPATAVEIGGVESSGTTFSFTHSAGGTTGFIRIHALGYQPITFDPYTYSSSDTTLLIQQVVDRNYSNP